MPRLEIDIAVDDAPVPGARANGGGDRGAGEGPHVRGTLHGPDGTVSTFVGWVGLLALLQQAITQPAPARAPAPPAPTPGTG
jgi:hypothetical protein